MDGAESREERAREGGGQGVRTGEAGWTGEQRMDGQGRTGEQDEVTAGSNIHESGADIPVTE